MSQHLRVLKDGGLVVSRAEGTRRIYQLNPEGVAALRAWLDGVWGDALAGFQKAADAAAVRRRPRTGEPMTTTAPIPPITGTVTVGVPVEQAFEVFTGSFDAWWPHQYHIGQAEVAEVVLEPQRGRALVRARRRRQRVRLGPGAGLGAARTGWCSPGRSTGRGSSTPTPTTPARSRPGSAPTGPAQTTVEVEHRYFERLVGGQAIHDAIRGGGGWALLLDGFAKTVANQPMTTAVDAMGLARDERADLADLLATLTPAAVGTRRRCAPQWRVRDVVAHMFSYEDLGTIALARPVPRGTACDRRPGQRRRGRRLRRLHHRRAARAGARSPAAARTAPPASVAGSRSPTA